MTFLSKHRVANVHNFPQTPLVPSFFIENRSRKFREAEGVWVAVERLYAPAASFKEAKRQPQTEELGITQANVDEFLASQDPLIQRFLATEPAIGEAADSEGILVGGATLFRLKRSVRLSFQSGSIVILTIMVAIALGRVLAGTEMRFELPALRSFNIGGGKNLSPGFAALLIGLIVKFSAAISEIVRGHRVSRQNPVGCRPITTASGSNGGCAGLTKREAKDNLPMH